MHQVREVREAARAVTSLDRPVGEEDGASLGELFPSEEAEPVEEVDREVARAGRAPRGVRAAGSRARDRALPLRARGRPAAAVEQVVRSLGVSRAEVRQIEHRALERLAGRREVEARARGRLTPHVISWAVRCSL